MFVEKGVTGKIRRSLPLHFFDKFIEAEAFHFLFLQVSAELEES